MLHYWFSLRWDLVNVVPFFDAVDSVSPNSRSELGRGKRSSFAENYIFVKDNDVTCEPSSSREGKRAAETSQQPRRRRKSFTKEDAESMLNEAKSKINITLQIMQCAMPYTVEDAMKKLASMQNLTYTALCTLIDAFNETPNNVTVFMILDGSRLEIWIAVTVMRHAQFGRKPIFTDRLNPTFDLPPIF
ncbi:hypothetical protein AXF42_Ash004898 [Apostasia shenzhenica]|uniref:Uncharacterized protein n=1 Tax=Apostasia shenzhenica TaxID=1088818 RepID=A0A2I0B7V9_9ASPA|nr:hypothetical protein AXF42_Ash004898 [Apostasia shenzhenica]